MISEDYKRIITQTRNEKYPYWGSGGWRHAEPVVNELQKLGINSGTILDYGSGLGAFGAKVRGLYGSRYLVTNYEPTHPVYRALPTETYDAVVCTHVLEHIEPEILLGTLREIWYRAEHLAFFEIPHGPAKEVLTDGRNAHLIQESADWWLAKLRAVWGAEIPITVRPSMAKTQTQYTVYCKKCA